MVSLVEIILSHTYLLLFGFPDLNQFEQRPMREYISIEGDQFTDSELSIKSQTSLADHPLVVGPRYQPKDLSLLPAYTLGVNSSGLLVYGIGHRGCHLADELRKGNFLRTYEIRCKFGRATHNFFEEGSTKEKTSYKRLNGERFYKLIGKTVSSHRTMIYRSMGIDLHSQEAYELLAAGPTRPFSEQTAPLLFNLKCLHFKPPDFTLELLTVNEEEEFIGTLVHGLGLKMRSTACISSLRCTRYGYFNVDKALLEKNLTVEKVINNIGDCSDLITEDKLSPVSPNIGPDDSSTRASFLEMIEQNKEKFLITQSPVMIE